MILEIYIHLYSNSFILSENPIPKNLCDKIFYILIRFYLIKSIETKNTRNQAYNWIKNL